MSDTDIDAAVAAALSANWQKAVEINSKLLEQCPEDVDCLNRIGKAYFELGDNKKAAASFHRVLKINKYDQIALKNLARLGNTSSTKKMAINNHQTSPLTTSSYVVSFLEEPGKTKVISLVNIAPVKTLLSLRNADSVNLTPKRHMVMVTGPDNSYLGALPDDIGHRLLVLIKGGNRYIGFIKSVSKNSLGIFVKEEFRAKRFHNTPSFPASGADYLSFIRDDSGGESEISASHTEGTEDSDGEEVAYTKSESMHQDEVAEE